MKLTAFINPVIDFARDERTSSPFLWALFHGFLLVLIATSLILWWAHA